MDDGTGVMVDSTARDQVLADFDELLSGTSMRSKRTILTEARKLIERYWHE